jgi:deoxycytidylate deaminase
MTTHYYDYVLERLKYLSDLAREKPMVYRAKIVAGIYIRNNLIAVGENSYKTHPFQARFSKHEDCIYLHAEIDAIKNALREVEVDELARAEMYVARMKWNSGEKEYLKPGMAKPCEGCQRAIATFDISHVYYTIDETGYDML